MIILVKVDDIIKELYKKQDLWLRYLKSWGCNPDTAKDLVQEMYIKIDVYVKKYNKNIMYNETEVNYFFVYTTLYKMFLDLKRKEKKVTLYQLNSNPTFKFDYTLTNFGQEDANNYREYMNDHLDYKEEEDEWFEKNKALTDWYTNEDFIEMTSINSGNIDKLDKEKLLNYYLRKIFEEVFVNKKSITQLSKDTKISYYSLYNTIRNIKDEIKKKYENR